LESRPGYQKLKVHKFKVIKENQIIDSNAENEVNVGPEADEGQLPVRRDAQSLDETINIQGANETIELQLMPNKQEKAC